MLRNEDLDRARCRPEFVSAMFEDLAWFGLRWQEGPDIGGDFAHTAKANVGKSTVPHLNGSRRGDLFRAATPVRMCCEPLQALHSGEDEPVYPGTCRPKPPELPLPVTRSPWPANQLEISCS